MENENPSNLIDRLIAWDKRKYVIAGAAFLAVILLIFLFRSGVEEDPRLRDREDRITDISETEDKEENDRDEVDTEYEMENDILDEMIRGEKKKKVDPRTGEEHDVIVYSGTGVQEMRIEESEEDHVLFYIQGNKEREHFVVTGYTETHTFYGGGVSTRMFVNTFSPYEGVLLDPGGRTRVLEVKAEGPWKVEVRSVNSAREIEVPGELKGEGGEVLRIEGTPQRATIVGNLEARHTPENFEVNAYNDYQRSLVRTSDAYEGTVSIPSDTAFLEVITGNKWEITLE